VPDAAQAGRVDLFASGGTTSLATSSLRFHNVEVGPKAAGLNNLGRAYLLGSA
jgi:hypothetical protein